MQRNLRETDRAHFVKLVSLCGVILRSCIFRVAPGTYVISTPFASRFQLTHTPRLSSLPLQILKAGLSRDG